MTTNRPEVVSRAEWLVARKDLLAREKAFSGHRDALNTESRRLPMVMIDKDYVFDGPGGAARLLDLFEGRRQLIVYHFMLGRLSRGLYSGEPNARRFPWQTPLMYRSSVASTRRAGTPK
jgi:predicted dithiol-disulfide oxidoreductase (DUF899 family)